MKTLFFNPATNVIFGSEDPQSGDIESISNIRAAELTADGAAVDESANDLLGKSDSSDGATSDDAPAAPAPDASATTSDTGADAVPLADGGEGEQGNDPAVASTSPSATAETAAESEQPASQESATAQGDTGVIVPVADAIPSDEPQLAAADKVDATVEDPQGNVVAGGAPLVVTTSNSTAEVPKADPNSDEHPVKTRARWLRQKIEAEEAIVMSQLVEVLRDIEAAL